MRAELKPRSSSFLHVYRRLKKIVTFYYSLNQFDCRPGLSLVKISLMPVPSAKVATK